MLSDDESGYDSNSHATDYAIESDDVFCTDQLPAPHFEARFEFQHDHSTSRREQTSRPDSNVQKNPKPNNMLLASNSTLQTSYVVKKSNLSQALVLETTNQAGETKQRALLNPDRFKTQMCKAYKRGSCLFAEQCQFAHGISDLRAPKVHQKYKTVKCKNYASGNCSHGNDCWFLHENDAMEKTLKTCMKKLSKGAENEIKKWSTSS